MYPEHNQLDPDNPDCREESIYPANPDSEYGWEKLSLNVSTLAYNRNYGIPVPGGSSTITSSDLKEPGKVEEKTPAAICRKVAIFLRKVGNRGVGR